MNKLIAKFKPEHVMIAQTEIVGYRFDEATKVLHFLSQSDADALTSHGTAWTKITE